MEEVWYKLDNAAKIYPCIAGENWSPIYRVDAVLENEVNPRYLQTALLSVYKRFPTFSVHIVKGLFWYYFEPNESEPEITCECTYPASPFTEGKDKGYLFRVLYYKKRISLEVFHSITDGHGASVFLKSLLFSYFTVENGQMPVSDSADLQKYGILYYKDLPEPQEIEDSFQHFALKHESLKLHENLAFKIPGTRLNKNAVRVTHVLMSVSELHRLAKKFSCTITEFLTSVYIYSVLDARIYNASDTRPIKISVPVNLRRHFPSETMRNFSSYINTEFFPWEYGDKVDFDEICTVVSKQIKKGLNIDDLRSKFSSNVNAEKNIMMRAAPLFLKDMVLRTTFSLYGERITTSTLSNIGSINLPEEMAKKVERFDFVLGAPKQNAMNCAVISFKDIISISFTSAILENSVIKSFVDFLQCYGIDISVETNY